MITLIPFPFIFLFFYHEKIGHDIPFWVCSYAGFFAEPKRFMACHPIVKPNMDWLFYCLFCAADGNTIAIDEMGDKSLGKMEKLIRRSRDFDDLAPVEFQTGAAELIKLFDPFIHTYMNTTSLKIDNTPIILSTGIFDLLKDHIRRRKLSKFNEEKLKLELRYARQVLRKELPEDVVTVDTCVRVKELGSGNEFTYTLVAPGKARDKHKTLSILSPIGVAMLGYVKGAKLQWEMADGIKAYQIEEVTKLG